MTSAACDEGHRPRGCGEPGGLRDRASGHLSLGKDHCHATPIGTGACVDRGQNERAVPAPRRRSVRWDVGDHRRALLDDGGPPCDGHRWRGLLGRNPARVQHVHRGRRWPRRVKRHARGLRRARCHVLRDEGPCGPNRGTRGNGRGRAAGCNRLTQRRLRVTRYAGRCWRALCCNRPNRRQREHAHCGEQRNGTRKGEWARHGITVTDGGMYVL